MEPLVNPSHIQAVQAIRHLEELAVKKRDRNTETDIKQHKKLIKLWKNSTSAVEVQKEHAEKIIAQSGPDIKRRESLFIAREHSGNVIPLISDAERNCERDWKFLRDFEKAKQDKVESEGKLFDSIKAVQKAEGEFLDSITEIATRYLAIGKTPDPNGPLFEDVNRRLAILKTRNHKELSANELQELDKKLDPIFDQLIEDSKANPTTTTYLSIVRLVPLIQISPSYVTYRLSKISLDTGGNVANILLQELPPPLISVLAKEFIKHEIATSKPELFLRGDSVKEAFLSKFQENALKPIFESSIIAIQKLLLNRDLELDPTKNTQIVDAQRDIKGVAILSLDKIIHKLTEKGKEISEDLKEIFLLLLGPERDNNIVRSSSFFFLRFLCPSLIINDLKKPEQQRRNVILLNKLLQQHVNNERPNQTWMQFSFDDKVFLDKVKDRIGKIVDLLILPPIPNRTLPPIPAPPPKPIPRSTPINPKKLT